MIKELADVDVGILDEYFKARELYSGEKVYGYVALRLDVVGGRRVFKYYSGRGKPRSIIVHKALVEAARRLLTTLNCYCSYVVSDEINIVCKPPLPYAGRVEKLVSISASIASSTASQILGVSVFFDSRVIILSGCIDVSRYIAYRMRVGFNNYVSQLYHAVTGVKHYTPKLETMLNALKERGVNISYDWSSIGTCICRVDATRITGETVAARHRLISVEGVKPCRECCKCDELST